MFLSVLADVRPCQNSKMATLGLNELRRRYKHNRQVNSFQVLRADYTRSLNKTDIFQAVMLSTWRVENPYSGGVRRKYCKFCLFLVIFKTFHCQLKFDRKIHTGRLEYWFW
jgi:hypothetical protein